MRDESVPQSRPTPAAAPSRSSSSRLLHAASARTADAWLMRARTAMHALLLSLQATAGEANGCGSPEWRVIAAKSAARFASLRALVGEIPDDVPAEMWLSIANAVEALSDVYEVFSRAPTPQNATLVMRAVDATMQSVPSWRRSP